MLRFLQSLLKKTSVLGPAAPWISKASGWKRYPSFTRSLYLSIFRSSASAAAVPGLQTDPALILQGAKESTTVTSHKSCLPSAHGTSVKPSGRFWSVLQRCRGSKTDGMWVDDRLCFIRAFRFECLENLPALLRQERQYQPSSVTSFPHTHLCRSHIFDPNRSPIAILSCWFDSFNLKFLHGMTFNHREPNLSWNALNLFTSVGSSRKIKSAI